ncbi:MAG: hypothetical protein ACAF41_28390 [Leptolyngbya sp. BL-A-14]
MIEAEQSKHMLAESYAAVSPASINSGRTDDCSSKTANAKQPVSADDPRLSQGIKAFLKEINSAGMALESLTPLEARQVLVDVQASAPEDLSGIDES